MFSGYVEAKSDAEGRYTSVALSPEANPYFAQAYKAVTYAGRRYCVRLAGEGARATDAFNATAGAVRDWRWRLTGDSGEAPTRSAASSGAARSRSTTT